MIENQTNNLYTKQIPLLESHGIFAIYQGMESSANVVALSGVDITLQPKEFVSIVGRSGAGKSTLLRILGGLQRPNAGTIRFKGQEITKMTEDQLVPFRRKSVGFIFQEGNLIPELSAFENIRKTLRYNGFGYSEARTRAAALLRRLGLASRMKDLPHRLSGGELQRVSIARALANNPSLILADEPTGNLDNENSDQVMGIFKELIKEIDASILIVTHSQHVASFSDRNIELKDGKIIGHHDKGSILAELDESRSVIISDNGNMTLPPDIFRQIQKYGNLWDVKFQLVNTIPQFIGVPKKEIKNTCPVCNAPIGESSYFCSKCGAQINR